MYQMTDNLKSLFSREEVPNIFRNIFINKNNNKKQNQIKTESQYGKRLRESKKISLFYGNLSKKYLQKIFHQTCHNASQMNETIFSILESRLDLVLYRAGLFESIAGAKQMVRAGGVQVNKKKVISPSYILTPGDIVSVSGKKNRRMLLKKVQLKPRFINEIDSIDCKSVNTLKIFDSFPENKTNQEKKPNQIKANSLSLSPSHIKKEGFENKNIERYDDICLKKENGWRFKTSPTLLSFISEKKSVILMNTINNVLGLHKFFIKNEKESKAVKQNRSTIPLKNDFHLYLRFISSFNKHHIVKKRENTASFSSTIPFTPKKIESAASIFQKDLAYRVFEGVSPFFEKSKENFTFLNYLLYLKKHFQKKNHAFKNKENKFFIGNPSFFDLRKTKPLHLEVSYQSLSLIFLFPPQRICFPDFINLSLIFK